MGWKHKPGRAYRGADGWWMGSWYGADGRRHRMRLAQNKAEAQAVLDEIVVGTRKEVLLGRPEVKGVSFGDYASRFYLQHVRPRLSKSAYGRDWTGLRLATQFFGGTVHECADPHTLQYAEEKRPFSGGVPLHLIRPARITEYMNWRLATPTTGNKHKTARPRGPYGCNKELQMLRKLFRTAKGEGYCLDNPAADVPAFRHTSKPYLDMTPDEFETLVDCAAPHLKPLLRIMLDCGLRPGEAYTLRREHVDLERGTVTVHQSKTGQTKLVPLTPSGIAVLSEVLRLDRHPYIFRDDEGRPYQGKRGCLRAFKTACRRAFAQTQNARFLRFVPYSIRHSTGTWLGDEGLGDALIGQRLGHTPLSTATRRYVHVGVESGALTAKVLETVLSKGQNRVENGNKTAMGENSRWNGNAQGVAV